ncbi:hypothetical protein ACKWRH_07095 [Bradyrhizobium sp. Pa8]|uniref:hypothetical protein n=1 Tax=Bradyrhizobium sp. Pa8 TaxID=3386552 RepID=UPI00403F8D56
MMGLFNRVAVLDDRRTIVDGTPEEVQANPALGVAHYGACDLMFDYRLLIEVPIKQARTKPIPSSAGNWRRLPMPSGGGGTLFPCDEPLSAASAGTTATGCRRCRGTAPL